MISYIIYALITLGYLIYYLRRFGFNSLLIYSFIVGMGIGITLDFILAKELGLWAYTHHVIGQPDYWVLIATAWGVFGVQVLVTYRLLNLKLKNKYICYLGCLLINVITCEIMGVVRDIWRYDAPLWLMVIGWLMLISSILVITFSLGEVIGFAHETSV